jgi:hypothetical protein
MLISVKYLIIRIKEEINYKIKHTVNFVKTNRKKESLELFKFQ